MERRGAEGCGLHCLGQDAVAGRGCAEKVAAPQRKSAAQSALPAGAFGWVCRGSESVLGTFVLDSPSKVLFTSVLSAQLWRQPLRRRLVLVRVAQQSWRPRE